VTFSDQRKLPPKYGGHFPVGFDFRGKIYFNSLHSETREHLIPKLQRFHHDTCITAVQSAKSLVNNSLPQSSLNSSAIPRIFRGDAGSEWRYIPQVTQRYRGADCLVYSFGVQHRDEFTNFYTAQGCDVFAFDPTVSHYSVPAHTNGVRQGGVTFYSWGLKSTEVTYPYEEATNLGEQYGTVSGALYSLLQIISMLGHRGRTIAALKLDCEGCEFAAFRDLWCEEALGRGPPVVVASLVLEIHMMYSRGLPRMSTSADVERIRYTGLWLRDRGYTSFLHKTHAGTLHDYRGGLRTVHPDLEAAGIDVNTCCYLLGFVREDLFNGTVTA